MQPTWTERADKMIALLEALPVVTEDGPEKEFRRAVWSLCQQIKEADAGGGQIEVPPLF